MENFSVPKNYIDYTAFIGKLVTQFIPPTLLCGRDDIIMIYCTECCTKHSCFMSVWQIAARVPPQSNEKN